MSSFKYVRSISRSHARLTRCVFRWSISAGLVDSVMLALMQSYYVMWIKLNPCLNANLWATWNFVLVDAKNLVYINVGADSGADL